MTLKPTSINKDTSLSFCFSLGYIAVAGLVEFGLRGQLQLFYGYLLMSILALFWYGKDKYAAIKGNWRTPEIWLHTMSLLGGWPGALLGRSWLRHKSKKQPFTAIFWFTVVINISFFIAILTPKGQHLISQLLAFVAVNKL